MKEGKTNKHEVWVIILAWIIAVALVYLVYTKIKIFL